jgi:hypothetical protein
MDGGGAALRAARVGVAGAFGVRRVAASVAVGCRCSCGCGWSGSGGMLNACSNACVGGTTPLNLAVPAAIVGGIERLVYMCDVVECRRGD